MVEDVLPIKTTLEGKNLDDDLRNYGLESLTLVELVIRIEDQFDISFPEDKITYDDAGTLRKLNNLIKDLKG